MGGDATQALKDYAIMTGTFWCAPLARRVCLPAAFASLSPAGTTIHHGCAA